MDVGLQADRPLLRRIRLLHRRIHTAGALGWPQTSWQPRNQHQTRHLREGLKELMRKKMMMMQEGNAKQMKIMIQIRNSSPSGTVEALAVLQLRPL